MPALPAMTRLKVNAAVSKSLKPLLQQRKGFHVSRENSPGNTDNCLDAQLMTPCPYVIRTKRFQQRLHLAGPRSVARDE